jgi:hypothetical protein
MPQRAACNRNRLAEGHSCSGNVCWFLGAIADAVMIVVGYPHGVYRIAFFDSLDVGRVITFVVVSDAPSLSVRVSFPTGTVHSNSIAPGSAAKRAR